MNKLSKKKSLEKKLAFVALLLAVFAIFAGKPINYIDYPDWKIRESTVEGNELKLISVTLLADWFKEKRDDFILVDLRGREKFDLYHIPEAVRFPDVMNLSLAEKTKIVVYADDEKLPDNQWNDVSEKFVNEIFLLDSGMEMWRRIILFPDVTKMIIEDEKQIKKIANTSRYFGGNPKLPQKFLPKSSNKYLREGC